jgi:hypothetical protein
MVAPVRSVDLIRSAERDNGSYRTALLTNAGMCRTIN